MEFANLVKEGDLCINAYDSIFDKLKQTNKTKYSSVSRSVIEKHTNYICLKNYLFIL